MSDLKYQNLAQLYSSLDAAIAYRKLLKSQVSGQDTRIYWIQHYLDIQYATRDFSNIKLGSLVKCADRSQFVVRSLEQDGNDYLLNGRRYDKLGRCLESFSNSLNIVSVSSEK